MEATIEERTVYVVGGKQYETRDLAEEAVRLDLDERTAEEFAAVHNRGENGEDPSPVARARTVNVVKAFLAWQRCEARKNREATDE